MRIYTNLFAQVYYSLVLTHSSCSFEYEMNGKREKNDDKKLSYHAHQNE